MPVQSAPTLASPSLLDAILSGLSAIPEHAAPVLAALLVACAAITAAFVAFYGVKRTIKAADERLLLELKNGADQFIQKLHHESAEAHAGRTAELRRSVYLGAMEEMVTAQHFMLLLHAREIEPAEVFERVRLVGSAIAKVSLVCKQEARQTVSEVNQKYAEILSKASTAVAPAQKAKAKVILYIKQEQERQKVVDQCIAEYSQLLVRADQAAIGRMKAMIDVHNTFLDDRRKFRAEAETEYSVTAEEFRAYISEELESLMKSQEELTMHLRHELGMLSAFEEAFREAS